MLLQLPKCANAFCQRCLFALFLHQSHSGVSRPALFVIISDNVFIVWIGVLSEVTLDQIARLVRRKAEENVQLVDVARIQPDRMRRFGRHVLEAEEIVGHRGRTRHFGRAVQPEQQQIQHQPVKLYHKRRELQPTQNSVVVRVVHVLVGQLDVVLGSDVVGDVVVHDQTQKSGTRFEIVIDYGMCFTLGIVDTV